MPQELSAKIAFQRLLHRVLQKLDIKGITCLLKIEWVIAKIESVRKMPLSVKSIKHRTSSKDQKSNIEYKTAHGDTHI